MEASEKKKKARTKNFSRLEDEVLCRCWIHVSEDAIVGTNQTLGSLWERITKEWITRMGENTGRNSGSLSSRWGIIQRDVSKFQGFVNQVVRLNQSGTTSEDRFDKAKRTFLGVKKEAFKFESCYWILEGSSKWNELVLARSNTGSGSKKQKTSSESEDEASGGLPIPSNPTMDTSPTETISLSEDNDHQVKDVTKDERPDGRKSSKEKRKLASESSETKKFLSSFSERLQKVEENSTKEVELKEASLRMKQAMYVQLMNEKNEKKAEKTREKEEKIMAMDLTNMNGFQKAYWLEQQKAVYEKWQSEIQSVSSSEDISNFRFQESMGVGDIDM